MDTVAGDKSGDTKVLQSTISRFACRIIADRNDVNNCRIYAAGFDSSRNIFLGVSDRYFYRKVVYFWILCNINEFLSWVGRLVGFINDAFYLWLYPHNCIKIICF